MKLLTRQEAAEYLRVCPRTLDQLRADSEIPYYKVRGKIVMSQEDIDDYLKGARVMDKYELVEKLNSGEVT